MPAATTTLLIDAGNSSLKWALCHNGRLEAGDPVVYQWPSLEQQLTEAWSSFTKKNVNPAKIILANVAGEQVLDALNRWRAKALVVEETDGVTIEIVTAQASAYGVTSAYEQSETLGADRWAALVAARHHVEGDACIIDCGTAFTIDILAANGEHVGGTIAPGWEMMENSLVANTKSITSAESGIPELLGKTTQQAIQAGISAACAGAVEHIVRRYQNGKGRELTCVLTGGAAPLLLSKLSSSKPLSSKSTSKFYYEPDWVLKGLAIISGNPLGEALINESGDLS